MQMQAETPKAQTVNGFIVLDFPGIPKAVQSMRYARIGNFMRKYQPKDVIEWKNYIRILLREQLPPGFQPLAPGKNEMIELRAVFVFPVLKGATKADRSWLAQGGLLFHNRKPDVTDNLMKGLSDAFTGILWTDDSKVCMLKTMKIDAGTPTVKVSVRVRDRVGGFLSVMDFLTL